MKQQLPVILSMVALATALVAVMRSGSDSSSDRAPAGPGASAQTPSATLPGRVTPASPAPRAVARSAPQEDANQALLIDLQQRLQQLEMTLTDMRLGWEQLARRGLVPLSESDVLYYQQLAMNPSLSTEERLEALTMLRRHGAINDQVAQSMAQMAQATTDPRLREQLLGQMDGLTNAALQGVLLAAIAPDQETGLRRRAADALSGFASDPTVQSWLRHLQENDPDEGVRREARQALGERLQGMEPAELQQVVLNTEVSIAEKLAAMDRLGREDARSPEVIAAMIGLSQTSEDPNIRAMIYGQLDGLSDPALRDPLLTSLASDEDARVRAQAADALSGFRSDPDVAAWLQHIAQNDPDPRVQREAQAALRGEEPRGGGPPFGQGGRGGRGDRGGR